MNAKNSQPSLFEEGALPLRAGMTVVEVVQSAKPQSRQQAAFQRLIRQIEERRTQVVCWRQYQVRYNQRILEEMQPLYDKLRKKQSAMLQLLDRQFDTPGAIRGKRQREKLSAMILEFCISLLQQKECDRDLVIAIHDKHTELSFEEAQAFERSISMNMIEQMFGVSLDESEISAGDSMGDLLNKAARKLSGEYAKRAEEKPPRKKSAKAVAAEEKRLAAEKEVSQSVREVYRKLASALHPDRQSQDLTAGQKTSLMQRVNRAYDEGNLLELLNIQLEIEQIDADHLSGLSDARVAHYNKVLRDQLKELDSELFLLKSPFCAQLSSTYDVTPERVEREVNKDIREIERLCQQIAEEFQAYEDPRVLALVLKNYRGGRPGHESGALDDILFEEMMSGGTPYGFEGPAGKTPRKSHRK